MAKRTHTQRWPKSLTAEDDQGRDGYERELVADVLIGIRRLSVMLAKRAAFADYCEREGWEDGREST